jgi:hypothetical protein
MWPSSMKSGFLSQPEAAGTLRSWPPLVALVNLGRFAYMRRVW